MQRQDYVILTNPAFSMTFKKEKRERMDGLVPHSLNSPQRSADRGIWGGLREQNVPQVGASETQVPHKVNHVVLVCCTARESSFLGLVGVLLRQGRGTSQDHIQVGEVFYSLGADVLLDIRPHRPMYKIAFWVLVADVLVLGYCGGSPAEPLYVIVSQIAAAYYFAHFLIVVPIISHLETPKPLPGSITEAVLAKTGA